MSATVTGSKVVLAWGGEGGETYYEADVYLPNGTLYKDSKNQAMSFTYSPVPTTGTYTWRLRAGNCFGPGPWSATKSFKVLT